METPTWALVSCSNVHQLHPRHCFWGEPQSRKNPIQEAGALVWTLPMTGSSLLCERPRLPCRLRPPAREVRMPHVTGPLCSLLKVPTGKATQGRSAPHLTEAAVTQMCITPLITPGTHAEQVGCKPLGVTHSFLSELLPGQPSKV